MKHYLRRYYMALFLYCLSWRYSYCAKFRTQFKICSNVLLRQSLIKSPVVIAGTSSVLHWLNKNCHKYLLEKSRLCKTNRYHARSYWLYLLHKLFPKSNFDCRSRTIKTYYFEQSKHIDFLFFCQNHFRRNIHTFQHCSIRTASAPKPRWAKRENDF